jgi:arsenate reductase
MAETGVQLAPQRAKHVDELRGVQFDHVVTVCGRARESHPFFPAVAKAIHVGFDDPPELGRYARAEEERLAPYRRVRDEIRRFVELLLGVLQK